MYLSIKHVLFKTFVVKFSFITSECLNHLIIECGLRYLNDSHSIKYKQLQINRFHFSVTDTKIAVMSFFFCI